MLSPIDLTNSAITTLFVAMVYSLLRVVRYFISKRNGADRLELDEKHVAQLNIMKKILEENNKLISRLSDMHEVFDSNRVPIWYVPAELLTTIRNINTEITILNKEVIDTMSEIKSGQTVLVDKLSGLINSQRLMTERLGDLITKMNKMLD